jgi:hypothetical protein
MMLEYRQTIKRMGVKSKAGCDVIASMVTFKDLKKKSYSRRNAETIQGIPLPCSAAVFSYNRVILLSMTHSILRMRSDIIFKNIDQQALQ